MTSRLAELAAEHERIEVLEGASALALWSRRRALRRRPHRPRRRRGRGDGAGDRRRRRALERTTNPRGAIGAGAVLAHAAGAELADLELCQFHPTALAAARAASSTAG